MAKKYLDEVGLAYFWGKVKAYVDSHSGGGGGGSVLDYYPVGSYYETSNSNFNPNTSWGGTWVLETEGLVHIGAGSNYTLGSTGGEATHQLTEDELPNITGTIKVRKAQNSSGSSVALLNTASGAFTHQSVSDATVALKGGSNVSNGGADTATLSFGNDGSHNNMQPYVSVNRWHRTA